MPVHVKVGGAWKLCDAVHVRVGGVWKELDQAHVRVGGVWKESLSSLPVTSMFGGFVLNVRFNLSCYAKIELRADGTEWKSNNAGAMNGARDSWLDSGSNLDCYVEVNVDSGSLDFNAASGGRIQINGTRMFGVVQDGVGTASCTFTLKIYDAISGGTLIESVQYSVSAIYETF